MTYQPRKYRQRVNKDLLSYQVRLEESDILISSKKDLHSIAYLKLEEIRSQIKNYIEKDKKFLETHQPYSPSDDAPSIIKKMAVAAEKWNVGPMATVAGAVAEELGKELIKHDNAIIIENGGDIFAKMNGMLSVALYAGEHSTFTDTIALELDCSEGMGICTSSGTVGHSYSYGCADAVVVVAEDTFLADAAATSIANRLSTTDDITGIVKQERKIHLLKGLIICMKNKIAFWGDIKLKPIS